MLKPQDIVALLKVHTIKTTDWTYNSLATSLGMSASEVHGALKRCTISNLYDRDRKKILSHALREFLIYGLKYAFPGEIGPMARGIPTAHSAQPLRSLVVVDAADTYVWPSPDGDVRGQAIQPLYRSVPFAIQMDTELYVLLSLIDGIRVGRVREQLLAASELSQRLAVQ